jgi:hypothetical protein
VNIIDHYWNKGNFLLSLLFFNSSCDKLYLHTKKHAMQPDMYSIDSICTKQDPTSLIWHLNGARIQIIFLSLLFFLNWEWSHFFCLLKKENSDPFCNFFSKVRKFFLILRFWASRFFSLFLSKVDLKLKKCSSLEA